MLLRQTGLRPYRFRGASALTRWPMRNSVSGEQPHCFSGSRRRLAVLQADSRKQPIDLSRGLMPFGRATLSLHALARLLS